MPFDVPPLTPAEAVLAAGLDPLMLPLLFAHRARDIGAGIPFVLVSARRSPDHQAQLYADYEARQAAWERGGKVGPAPKPATKPGASKHELGFAYDRTGPRNPREWALSASHAEALGLESGHRYNDAPHIEMPDARSELATAVRLRLAAAAAALGLAWIVTTGDPA